MFFIKIRISLSRFRAVKMIDNPKLLNISGNIGVKPVLFKRSKDLLGRLHRVGTNEIRTISL